MVNIWLKPEKDKNYMIDAGRHGNLARFINHSCAPNASTECWSVNSQKRIGIFANQDIPSGSWVKISSESMLKSSLTENIAYLRHKVYCSIFLPKLEAN